MREENFNKETFFFPFLTRSYHSQTSLKFIDAVSKLFHFLNNVFYFFAVCSSFIQFNACENCTSKQIDRKTELKARKRNFHVS